ncbi:glutamate receptor ionotropic, kainate 2-like isoform X2 [Centruroides sculpturatus]|uniref:glutamate receptor ionotropic, kainate 2-like isoform X2 n=1 Tax=Centruroides sculpturatus TaxID=218467 RepID=UPI000C6D535C|nr:glutamate receptor ionotropic, kainate 2-like isoform X2 [Centruroides sculpturatus]
MWLRPLLFISPICGGEVVTGVLNVLIKLANLYRRNMDKLTLFCLLTLIGLTMSTLPDVIPIGALFETNDDTLEQAFRHAINRINDNKQILSHTRLQPHIERVKRHDSFQATRKVCELLSKGMAAIFGPQSSESSSAIQSTCSVLEVPHIQYRWDYRSPRNNQTVNLYPHPDTIGIAYRDFVLEKNWKTLAILYEDSDALIRLQTLLRDPAMRQKNVIVRQFSPEQEYRKLLKEMGRNGVKNMIIDVATENLVTVIEHAQQMDMMSEYYNYIFINMDMHTINVEPFQNAGPNITGFRLIDEDASIYKELLQEWKQHPLWYNENIEADPQYYKTEIVLMYDAVTLFATALNSLDRSYQLRVKPVSCDTEKTWPQGMALANAIKRININGLTGNIEFDKNGYRKDFKLTILDVTHEGLKQTGSWTKASGFIYSENFTRTFDIIHSLRNKTLSVTSKPNPPYIIKIKDKVTKKVRYEGFCVDLLDEIAKYLGFNYVIREVADKSYGKRDHLGEWNGMIRELMDAKADLAIGDITITYEREEVVDFTMPFMNLGIGILFKKPTKKIPKLFSFLSPLSVEVWLYMVTAFLGVSLFLFILARFSPYEWVNPHPCDQNPENLENQFNLLNTLWFTVGCLMQQGCDITPRSLSTRLAAGMWWFFTLIMVSSYTANLAAFLTVERLGAPIENVEDLAKQNHIQYGCVQSGSTQSFFMHSNYSTYKRMWSVMESARPSVFTEDNDKGVERVLKGNYAFLMESTSIEYRVERNCELTKIGANLDSKGYGVAFPTGSPYRTVISSAILKLQEKGGLRVLKDKWWRTKGGGKCAKEETSTSVSASELGLANVGGVFIVLTFGMALACIMVIGEFYWKSRKMPKDHREPLCVELCRELKLAMMCKTSKPAPKDDDEQHVDNDLRFMPLNRYSMSPSKDTFS